VLVNGGVNLWELDGWWAEAYTPEVGWVLGDGQEHRDEPAWDGAEAESLYNIWESKVVPELYARYNIGIPERWIQRMQRSMSTLTPQFSANRTVHEYTENYYLPVAVNYLKRATTKGAAAKEIVDEKPELQNKWNGLIITEVQSAAVENGFSLTASIFLNRIDTDKILVELFTEAKDGLKTEPIKMNEQQFNGDKLAFFLN